MKINILLCDTFPGLLPSYIESYESMFFQLFDSIRADITYQVYNVKKSNFPAEISRDELYLITGSNSGVYEDADWIKELICFVQKLHTNEAKLTGICFGHQLIAKALGGKVTKSEKGWGTGIRTSRIISSKALSYFPTGEMSIHYNHHDQVVKLPGEAELFATSEFCPHEGFMVGDHIITFQGHPEYTSDYNRHLILNHAQDEPENVKATALESINSKVAQGDLAAKWMLDLV